LVPVFNCPVYKGIFPDIHFFLRASNSPNVINSIQISFKELYFIVSVCISCFFLRTNNKYSETFSDINLEPVSMPHPVPTFILPELVETVQLMSRLATLLNVWLPTDMKNLFEPSTEWYLDPAYT
jgi:hypothetical protein